MRILGINLGDTATAAIMVGPDIVACVSEERFSRLKRDESYPRRAIDYCLTAAGLEGRELDLVAIGGARWDFWRWLTRYYSRFSIDDLLREQEEYWRPRLHDGKAVAWRDVFKDKWDGLERPDRWAELAARLGPELELSPGDLRRVDAAVDEMVGQHLGLKSDRIVRIDRNTALGAYAYWSSALRGPGTGVVVLDSGGEGAAASVSAPLKFGLIPLCSVSSADFRLGQLMKDVTLMLGLPPRDHDPVMMGLAAHAGASRWKPAYRVFEKSLAVSGLRFKRLEPMKDTYFHFLKRLSSLSPDAVAGGAQRFAEDLISKWIAEVARCDRLGRLAVTGSLAMNHRIMARVADLKAVEELFVPPGSGEGALALGACLQLATARYGVVPAPLSGCFLGPGVSSPEAAQALAALRAADPRCEVAEFPSPEELAALLAGGAVIGRCAGRAEFGSRALGNRSILADPRSAGVGAFLAAKIKERSAQVAFSPTILAGFASRYLDNPKALASPFMTLAFRAKPAARADLAGALAGGEETLRPQILEEAANPGFAAVLRAFARKTGVGALLNTSLNERGEPMALTAQDAARVFRNSSLDFLLLGDVLVGKSGATLRRRGMRGLPARR